MPALDELLSVRLNQKIAPSVKFGINAIVIKPATSVRITGEAAGIWELLSVGGLSTPSVQFLGCGRFPVGLNFANEAKCRPKSGRKPSVRANHPPPPHLPQTVALLLDCPPKREESCNSATKQAVTCPRSSRDRGLGTFATVVPLSILTTHWIKERRYLPKIAGLSAKQM